MTLSKTSPRYLISAKNPMLKEYSDVMKMLSRPDKHTLRIDFPPQLIDDMNASQVNELVLVIQHHPHLIEKYLFGFELYFPEVADSELYLGEEVWGSEPKYLQWFQKISECPVALFFIHDTNMRNFFLMGDLIAHGKVQVNVNPDGKGRLEMYGDEMQIVCGRLFNACWLFHIYCHGTGFNPKDAIESVLADLDTPVTYDMVREEYESHIKKGTHFSAEKN
jgi:hypothetical protein